MRVGFTGTRPPEHWGWKPFTMEEINLIQAQVDDLARYELLVKYHELPLNHPSRDIIEIGTGACIGVDELVMEAAHGAGFHVVSFVPGDKPGEGTTPHLREWSDEIVFTGKEPLERNNDIVEWSQLMRAVALYEGEPAASGIYYSRRQPRSGTWACVRIAQREHKLQRLVMLRPDPPGTAPRHVEFEVGLARV